MARHVITPLYASSFDLTHEEYQNRYERLARDGYRLVVVDAFRGGRNRRYGGIWIRDARSGMTRARHGLDHDEYQQAFDELRTAGYRLISISGSSRASGSSNPRFIAVWIDGSFEGYHSHHGMSASGYQDKFEEYAAKGFRPIWVTGYADDGKSRYAAIWSKHLSDPTRARHNLSISGFGDANDELKSEGYRLLMANFHAAGSETYAAAIWIKRDGYATSLRRNESAGSMEEEAWDQAALDKQMTCLSGYELEGKKRFAAIWVPHARKWRAQGRLPSALASLEGSVQSFMQSNAVPGASLAITRNQELVMTRAYSWITDLEEPVQTSSLFRIGSISKGITATAIMTLVEDGKLSLSDKVYEVIRMPGAVKDERLKDVQIDHLVHHVGGWIRGQEGDPADSEDSKGLNPLKGIDEEIVASLGVDLPLTRDALIRFMTGRKLQFDPGQVGAYALDSYGGFAYLLLGEVIETVTGEQYEDYVRRRVLEPLGVSRMRLGRTRLEHRAAGEVLHHSAKYELMPNITKRGAPIDAMQQYGGVRSFELGSAAGAWLASAVDLVRYASAFDTPSSCPILNAASISQLFAQHAYGDTTTGGGAHYAFGWRVDRNDTWNEMSHGGSTESSKSTISRWTDPSTRDTYTMAFLINRNVSWSMPATIESAIKGLGTWPSGGSWDEFL